MKRLLLALAIVIITGSFAYTASSYNKVSLNRISQNAINQNMPNNKNNSSATKLNVNVQKIPASDFKLKDINGREVSLSDFKGKKVFLNFFTTWCPPCNAEMPAIEKLYVETKDSDLIILAVDLGEAADTVTGLIYQNNYNFKVLLDSYTKVAEKYEVASIPTSFFIDKDGNITAKHIGAMNISEMKNYINSIK